MHVVEKSKETTSEELVKKAIKHKENEGNPKDIYWVIYDRESVAAQSHDKHLRARKLAKDNNIEIALSNICIEYWFLLHFEYTPTDYNSCADLLNRSKFKKLLADKGIDNYDKGFVYLFNKLQENNGIKKALTHAQRITEQALNKAEPGKESPCYLNPYTDVHELLIDMKNFVDSKDSVRTSRANIDMQVVLIEMAQFIDLKDGVVKSKP